MRTDAPTWTLRFASRCGRLGQLGRDSLAQGLLGLQMDLVRAIQQAIQDSVGERGIADVLVPLIDRQLTGDERRAGADLEGVLIIKCAPRDQ